MRWFDATVPIRDGMIVFPGDPAVHVRRGEPSEAEGTLRLTHLDFSAHTGTHVDAPSHVFADGAGVETLSLDALVGPAFVADATAARLHLDPVSLAALQIPAGCERLVLKAGNSRFWDQRRFDPGLVAVTEEGACWLRDRGIRLVGIDYLSIAPPENPGPTHEVLLAAGIVILEGLDLRDVPAGDCMLVCLPLLIPGADGAPARVLIGREGDGG